MVWRGIWRSRCREGRQVEYLEAMEHCHGAVKVSCPLCACYDPRAQEKAAYLLEVGVYTADSVTSTVRAVSMTGCGFVSSSSVLVWLAVVADSATADDDASSVAEVAVSELGRPD